VPTFSERGANLEKNTKSITYREFERILSYRGREGRLKINPPG
jgi:hypothetical protein